MRYVLIFILFFAARLFSLPVLEPARSNKSCNGLITVFLYSDPDKQDTHLKVNAPIRGMPVRQTLRVEGNTAHVFRKLGEGGDSIAYLGLKKEEPVVFKVNKNSTSEIAFRREKILSDFLSKVGFKTAKVIEEYKNDRVLAKEFVRGFYLSDLEKSYQSGDITREQLIEAKESLKLVSAQLKKYSESDAFKDFCKRNNIPAYIDAHEQNFLYRNREWILIDP